MKTIIINKLKSLEQEHMIKILYACESGSRAWGFPSPNSDNDVRFVYLRNLNDYLSLENTSDFLDLPINNELDIKGWDLRKFLQLIRRSNATPFEWLQSPEIYTEEVGFRSELLELCQYYFDSRNNIFHYLGIASGALSALDTDRTIKIKRFFYILRPLLAAKWCIEKNCIAPMNIEPLMELLPYELKNNLVELIALKSAAPEGYLIVLEDKWLHWINETEQYCITKAKTLERKHFSIDLLNGFFNKTIFYYDNKRNKG